MKRKIYLYAFFTLFVETTYADWVLVINDSKGQFLIENVAIKRENSIREYWAIQNLRNPKDNVKSGKPNDNLNQNNNEKHDSNSNNNNNVKHNNNLRNLIEIIIIKMIYNNNYYIIFLLIIKLLLLLLLLS